VIAASVYTVLAFAGFEGAAPLAEESRNPGRTVQRAVVYSALGIGVLYVFTTYAAAVAFGPHKFVSFGAAGASSWQGLARTWYGLFWFFVFLAIVNSTIANANAGTNIASRIGFAMGRIRAFPHVLAMVHARFRSPWVAVGTTFATTVAITLGLGLAYNPVSAFAMVGTGIVILQVAVYIVANAACIGYFGNSSWRRADGHRWNPLLHLVIPVLGIVAFVPVWLAAAGIHAFSWVAPLTAPSSYMGPGVGGWMVAGLIYLVYLYRKHPQRIAEVGLVHLDAPAEEEEVPV
jgi:amino acid transporter